MEITPQSPFKGKSTQLTTKEISRKYTQTVLNGGISVAAARLIGSRLKVAVTKGKIAGHFLA